LYPPREEYTYSARLLWVDGRPEGDPVYVPALRRLGLEVRLSSTGREALALIKSYQPDIVVINAGGMRSNGQRLVSSLARTLAKVPVVLIAPDGQTIPPASEAKVILHPPFTVRKLINRLIALLPGRGREILQVGPIVLDLDRLKVTCGGRETTLTPRVAGLLKLFMEHPGEVLERERLIKKIWKTDYVGDTRTLDTHISWLRRAIETDPRRPKRLITLRRVGYRLDV